LLTRRLALKLLAPTVLVSLILVGACLFGTIYLNHLHTDFSTVLTDNVQSTQAAMQLETTTKELLRLLRSDSLKPDALTEQAQEQNERAREVLVDVERLANLERERALVPQIAQGLSEYLRRWEQRKNVPPSQLRAYDASLADHLQQRVLSPCIELRTFNMSQIEASDQENRAIVRTLEWGLFALGIGGPLGGLLLGYAVARQVYHSIYQLSVRIRDAAGRLNRELGSVTLVEHGDLPDLHQQMEGVLKEIGRVIDQLQQREHEVLRAEQLAAVGQVAAGVAHELRNPLTSIKMLAQTGLEGDPPAGLPAEDLAIMEHEVRRMEQCIQTFVDFARPPRSERRRTDLADVVQRALALVEGRAHRQQVVLGADLPPAPVYLMIDPEQIHQVLVNLLLNALDALPQGGKVRVEVASPPGRQMIQLRVRDTGPGIAPPIQGRLFEPFVSSKETGLGLGLSICKRLIEAHGGAIRGDNSAAGGAVFTVMLPQEEAAHACVAGRG
jgi:signal transduction histidine kinase